MVVIDEHHDGGHAVVLVIKLMIIICRCDGDVNRDGMIMMATVDIMVLVKVVMVICA